MDESKEILADPEGHGEHEVIKVRTIPSLEGVGVVGSMQSPAMRW